VVNSFFVALAPVGDGGRGNPLLPEAIVPVTLPRMRRIPGLGEA
jgi:hypothetical protein